MYRSRLLVPLFAAVLLGACGEDDPAPPSGAPTGASGAAGIGGSSAIAGAGGSDIGGAAGSGTGGTGGSSAGAGGSSAGTGGAAGSAATYSQLIKAAEGGTLTAPGVSLKIPPNALKKDLTVTVAIGEKTGKPMEADIAAKVFDFGPDATSFDLPVEMTIDFEGAPPAGKSAKIAYLQSGEWLSLPTTVAGGKATAMVKHFTPYTVAYLGDVSVNACNLPGFTPCGGDVVGLWQLQSYCTDKPIASSADPNCPDAKGSAAIDLTGTFDMKADFTYVNKVTLKLTESSSLPKSCIPGGGATCPPPDAKKGMTLKDTGTACEYETITAPPENTETGTWSRKNNQVSLVKDGAPPPAASDVDNYCVEGGQWVIRGDKTIIDNAPATTFLTLTKL